MKNYVILGILLLLSLNFAGTLKEGHADAAGLLDDSNAGKNGIRIAANFDLTLDSAQFLTNSVCDKAYLLDASKAIIGSSVPIVAHVATWAANNALTKGVTYYVACDKGGAVFAGYYINGAGAWPENFVNINITGALEHSGDYVANNYMSVSAVTTSTTGGSSPVFNVSVNYSSPTFTNSAVVNDTAFGVNVTLNTSVLDIAILYVNGTSYSMTCGSNYCFKNVSYANGNYQYYVYGYNSTNVSLNGSTSNRSLTLNITSLGANCYLNVTPFPANLSSVIITTIYPPGSYSYVWKDYVGNTLQSGSNSTYYLNSTYNSTRAYAYATSSSNTCYGYTLVFSAQQTTTASDLLSNTILSWFNAFSGLILGIFTAGIAYAITARIGHAALVTALMWAAVFILFGNVLFLFGAICILVLGLVLTYANV